MIKLFDVPAIFHDKNVIEFSGSVGSKRSNFLFDRTVTIRHD